jgi:hypothetical protein
MANNYNMLIRKHSWWHSAGSPKRTFIICELPFDFDAARNIIFDRVGLIEYGYDDTIWVPIDDFRKDIDSGAIVAMHSIPNIHPKPKNYEKQTDT